MKATKLGDSPTRAMKDESAFMRAPGQKVIEPLAVNW
jgi:hypothetical protein